MHSNKTPITGNTPRTSLKTKSLLSEIGSNSNKPSIRIIKLKEAHPIKEKKEISSNENVAVIHINNNGEERASHNNENSEERTIRSLDGIANRKEERIISNSKDEFLNIREERPINNNKNEITINRNRDEIPINKIEERNFKSRNTINEEEMEDIIDEKKEYCDLKNKGKTQQLTFNHKKKLDKDTLNIMKIQAAYKGYSVITVILNR